MIEKNKLDSIGRMTPAMKAVVEFEVKQSQNLAGQDFVDPYDRKGYIINRRYWNEGGPQSLRISNETIPGPHGDMPIRFYYPNEEDSNRSIVYLHGGGFIVGNLDTHDGIMRRLAAATGAVVIGLDYRLAPEYKFPVPIDECEALVNFIRENGEKYGLYKDDITLSGDSAGAYLSLATAVRMRDTYGSVPYIKALLLFYGAFGLEDSMSLRLYGGYWDGLTADTMGQYSTVFANREDVNSPYRKLFDSDLTYGLPPTFLAVGSLDPFLDDNRLLHAIMTENGMETELKVYEGIIHAFIHYSRLLSEAEEAIRDSAAFYVKYNN